MNALASFYSRFRVADRLLLTGHSHQAWPDVAFDAQQRAWVLFCFIVLMSRSISSFVTTRPVLGL